MKTKLNKIPILKSNDEISLKHLPLKQTIVHLKNLVFPAKRHFKPKEGETTVGKNKEKLISDSVALHDSKGKQFNLNIVDTLKMPDEELTSKLKDHLTHIYGKENVKHDADFYTYAKGDNPICLISHIDTLKRTNGEIGYKGDEIKDISRPNDEPIKKHKQVLGADDRAGIFSTLKVLEHCVNNKIDKPSIIFSNLEEDMGLGMKVFIKDGHFDPSKTNLLLSLDRQGANEFVYYTNGIPDKVHKYMENNGFKHNEGIYSDGLDLALSSRIPNVNISVGYHNAHTSHETLNVKEMKSNINRVMNMVENPIKEKHILTNKHIDVDSGYNEEYYHLLKQPRKKLTRIQKRFVDIMKA